MARPRGGTKRRRAGALVVLLAMVTSLMAVTEAPASAAHDSAPPTIEGPDTTNLGRCTGVDRGDPGEENTKKYLTGGSLVPGGTAEYVIRFPALEEDATKTFRVLDCMFAGTEAFALYEISNVTKHVEADGTAYFEFALVVHLPGSLPIGTRICNVAQTIGQSTGSPASNRKTGEACFVLGGTLMVKKVVAGTQAPLAGAVFRVVCNSSDTRPVVISPVPNGGLVTTPDTGLISIAGPEGSQCQITEVSAPSGYVVNDPATRTVTIPSATAKTQLTVTFVNSPASNLVITKVSDTPGTFTFTVNCPGTSVTNQSVTITVTAAGAPGTTSAPITNIPAGTVCTVTETTATGFEPQQPRSITLAGGTNTVTFTNVRQTGNLVITKLSDTPGTFTFTVNCPGTSVTNQSVTITVTAAGAPGTTSDAFTGIPTGTECTVAEATATGFNPQPSQTITIVQGTNTVTFTNVRQTGDLVVAKTTVGGTGTFSFAIDCNPGTAFDQTFSLTNNETRRISGIPTGTTCDVTEAASATFTSTVTPGDGRVVIATGENTVSFTNTIRPPVLNITKTADAATVAAGSAIGFTVTVSNSGPNPATAVTLSDPLPGGAGVSWTLSPAYAGPGVCSVTGTAPTQTLTCSFGDLAPAASVSVHVSSATTTATSGIFTNTAVAQAANHGPVSATAATTVTAAPPPPPVVQGVVLTQEPPPAAPPAAPPVVLGETLPRTGVNSMPMALMGWMFIAIGLAFRAWGNRHQPVRIRRR